MNGIGRHIYQTGDWYIGEFKNHLKFGQGTHCWKDGAKYTG